MKREPFSCKKCGKKMTWCENGSSEYNEEWLECNECRESRDLTIEEVEIYFKTIKYPSGDGLYMWFGF